MGRRRGKRVERISSDNLWVQGEGTWVEVRKKLRFQMLQPVIELAAWREDPRIQGEKGGDAQAEAMLEMMSSFGRALYPLVLNWNWLSDMEGELAIAPGQAPGDIPVKVRLEAPIWAGSDFCTLDDGRVGPPEFLWGQQPVYLGQFPENCQRMALEDIEDDGHTLVLRGDLRREYVPGDDYVLVGLPNPISPEAFTWLGIDEMTWLMSAFSERFQEEMKRREGRRHPKAQG